MAAGSYPSPTFATLTLTTSLVFPDGSALASAPAQGATGPAGPAGPAGATGPAGPAGSYGPQAPNVVLAGPASGTATGAPAFRALDAADLAAALAGLPTSLPAQPGQLWWNLGVLAKS